MRKLTRISILVAVSFMALSSVAADPQDCSDPQHPGICFIGESLPYQLGMISFDGALLVATTSAEEWMEFIGPDGSWLFGRIQDPAAEFFACTPDVWAAALVDFPNNLELCILNFLTPDPVAPGTLALVGTGKVHYAGTSLKFGGECPANFGVLGDASDWTGALFKVRLQGVQVPIPEGGCEFKNADITITPIFTHP